MAYDERRTSGPGILESVLPAKLNMQTVQEGFVVVAILGCALAMFPQTNFPGLLLADVGLLILMMTQLSDLKKGASVIMTMLPTLIVISMILWYSIITHRNQKFIETDSMPKEWLPNSRFISAALMAHVLLQLGFEMNGLKIGCFGWLTMAVIVIFVAMQHILAENFRTNG
jgi:hypothetical protein